MRPQIHMRFFVRLSCYLLLCVLALPVTASAIGTGHSGQIDTGIDYDAVKKELKNAKLYRVMRNVDAIIDKEVPHRCGLLIKSLEETRKKLTELHDEFDGEGKATADYLRQVRKHEDSIPKNIRSYKQCFTRNLFDFQGITAEGIYTHSEFTNRFGPLLEQFRGIDLDAHIAKLEGKLVYKGGFGNAVADAVTILVSTHKRVEVLPSGRGSRWKIAKPGYIFRLKDHMRTGPGAAARIKFNDHYKNSDAGQTVLNIGSDTHIKMTDFSVRLEDTKPKSNIEMFMGRLQAVVNIFGPRSSVVALRTGKLLGVIRGTEVAVSYDPTTDVAEYHLDHGDAYVESGGRQVALKPRTSLTVTRGKIGAPRPLSQAKWDGIVAGIGGEFSEGGVATHFGTENIETAKADIRPDTVAREARLLRSYARSVVDGVLFAMKENDKKALLKRTTGTLHPVYAERLKKQSLKSMLDRSGDRPLSHSFRCSICDSKGDKCQVLADIQREADPSGKLTAVLFDIKNSFRQASAAQRAGDKVLKEFMARNPVCGE